MDYIPTSIRPANKDSDDAYEVTLQDGNNAKICNVVANDPAGCVIDTDDEFFNLFEHDRSRLSLILEAVWAFHRARQADARSTVEPYYKSSPKHEPLDSVGDAIESPRAAAYRKIIERA